MQHLRALQLSSSATASVSGVLSEKPSISSGFLAFENVFLPGEARVRRPVLPGKIVRRLAVSQQTQAGASAKWHSATVCWWFIGLVVHQVAKCHSMLVVHRGPRPDACTISQFFYGDPHAGGDLPRVGDRRVAFSIEARSANGVRVEDRDMSLRLVSLYLVRSLPSNVKKEMQGVQRFVTANPDCVRKRLVGWFLRGLCLAHVSP